MLKLGESELDPAARNLFIKKDAKMLMSQLKE